MTKKNCGVLATTADCPEELENIATVHCSWKTSPEQHFILNFLIVLLWSSAIRPINANYNSWFFLRIKLVSALLEKLTEGTLELADPKIRLGIVKLAPIIQRALKNRNAEGIADEVDVLSYHHFGLYDRSWSHLTPVDGLRLDSWEQPTRLFFAFGPHIGIGDEIISFLAIEAISRTFPNIPLEVWSYSKNLWNWKDNIVHHYIEDDALKPFERAYELLQNESSVLICFCDFASDKIYRLLEVVPGFDRFFFLDIGSRIVRLVDQRLQQIGEYKTSEDCSSIYEALRTLLGSVGVKTPQIGSLIQESAVPAKTSRARILLNPHSSKEKESVSAEWWADSLTHLARSAKIEVEILSGINEGNLKFAQSIERLLSIAGVKSLILPHLGLDDVLTKALNCDLFVGLDTFTAHISTLRSVLSITVFFGQSGNAWRVPHNSVFNLRITDDPATLSKLAFKLLRAQCENSATKTLQELAITTRLLEDKLKVDLTCEQAHHFINRILELISTFFLLDQNSKSTFSNYPLEHLEYVKTVSSLLASGTYISESQRRVMAIAIKEWEGSNLCRYAKYVAELHT